MKKSITEFLAGGLFAFSVFAVSGMAVLASGERDPIMMAKKLAQASAAMSSPWISVSESADDPVNDPVAAEESGKEDFLTIAERILAMTEDISGSDEAVFETEEPSSDQENPSGSLDYPLDLGENGGRIIRRTYTYSPSKNCVVLPGGGMIKNSTDVSTGYLLEQAAKSPDIGEVKEGEPLVLIMHTHTTECYEPTERDRFDADFSLRTTDLDKSVVAVGREVTKVLEAAGIGVIHDTTLHDYPMYSGAYDRSSKTVERLLKEHPTIKIVIDIHRDAIESDGVRYAPVCEIDGKSAAQIMLICGCRNVPGYRYNLRFASWLQSKLEKDYPGLTRPILFADRNYNQELTKASVLIEMGSSSNSLDEALYSGQLLGMSLAELLEPLTVKNAFPKGTSPETELLIG